MKQSLRKYVGKRIRLLRLKKGLTQEQIEERADLGTNYVYKLEHLETNILMPLNVILHLYFILQKKMRILKLLN